MKREHKAGVLLQAQDAQRADLAALEKLAADYSAAVAELGQLNLRDEVRAEKVLALARANSNKVGEINARMRDRADNGLAARAAHRPALARLEAFLEGSSPADAAERLAREPLPVLSDLAERAVEKADPRLADAVAQALAAGPDPAEAPERHQIMQRLDDIGREEREAVALASRELQEMQARGIVAGALATGENIRGTAQHLLLAHQIEAGVPLG